MKNFITSFLVFTFLFCSFLGTVDRLSPTSQENSSSTNQRWYNNDNEILSAAICAEKTPSVRILVKTLSSLGCLGILVQLTYNLMSASSSYIARQIQSLNTSQHFIIRYIHDKDGP